MTHSVRYLASALLLLFAAQAHADEAVRVYAAASLTNAMTDIGTAWEKAGHAKPTLVFSASSTLAKQIESGAPADAFFSADQSWMDYLQQRGRILSSSRGNLLGNSLVLVVPRGRPLTVKLEKGFDLAGAFQGRLCTGEPGVVPVGIYARQALEFLGMWKELSVRIVGTDDVRTALAFVERGECPLGIVYATDAAISEKVEVLAHFPPESHAPIIYPAALVKGGRSEGAEFLRYVRSAPEAEEIFRRYGFDLLNP